MSLKAIELQVALHKTGDTGKTQNQMHQKSNLEQGMLVSQMKTTEIEKRKKTEKLKKTDMKEENTTKSPNKDSKEPYKGKYIDIKF